MKKYMNGEYIEMTAEEIAALETEAARYEAAERTRPLTAEEVTTLLIKQQVNTLEVDDSTALRMVEFYPEWAAGQAYTAGYKVQYGGTLYKCVQAHTSQADWTPDAAQALWVVVSIEEFPEWVQPTGAHDAYNIGDKVSYNGQHYVCTSDGNVYAPDVYGWEVTA